MDGVSYHLQRLKRHHHPSSTYLLRASRFSCSHFFSPPLSGGNSLFSIVPSSGDARWLGCDINNCKTEGLRARNLIITLMTSNSANVLLFIKLRYGAKSVNDSTTDAEN